MQTVYNIESGPHVRPIVSLHAYKATMVFFALSKIFSPKLYPLSIKLLRYFALSTEGMAVPPSVICSTAEFMGFLLKKNHSMLSDLSPGRSNSDRLKVHTEPKIDRHFSTDQHIDGHCIPCVTKY